MPNFYTFTNPFSVNSVIIPESQLASDIVLVPDDGFLTLTYSGSTTSRWFKFVLNVTSDVVVAGLINKTGATTRFTDNEQNQPDAVTMWINDNMDNEPGSQVWQDDDINFVQCRIDVVQDAATTPVVRSYRIRGDGRQSSLTRQPGDVRLEVFRIA